MPLTCLSFLATSSTPSPTASSSPAFPACQSSGTRVQASFYILYILTNGLLAKGVAFLRLPGAAIYFLLSRLAGTKRQKKKVWSQQYMEYGTDLPDHTITILLLFVFCIVQPFVAIVSLMYFAVVFFYARYDLLYTKREAYQTGGLFWPVVRLHSLA